MIRINLLPPAERQPAWRTGRIFATLTLLVVAALAGVHFYYSFMIGHTERRLAETRNQYELLRPTREAMLAAGAKQQSIDEKNGVLMALTRERTSWYAVLTQLGAKMPPELWLTDITADKNGLKMNGLAKSYPDLAAFMRKLEQEGIFAEPVLVKAEKDAASAATKFEMTVKIKGM